MSFSLASLDCLALVPAPPEPEPDAPDCAAPPDLRFAGCHMVRGKERENNAQELSSCKGGRLLLLTMVSEEDASSRCRFVDGRSVPVDDVKVETHQSGAARWSSRGSLQPGA